MDIKLLFFSIGDWGASNDSANMAQYVANVMSNYSLFHHPNFVLSLGDNFYEKGVLSVDDPKWDDAWYSRFIKPFPHLHNMRWFSILGNHDYYGGIESVKAELEMSTKIQNWVMPNNEYYSHDEKSNSYHIFLDTVKIYPELYEDTKQFYNAKDIENALWFLEDRLIDARRKKCRWLFVYGHYHIFSNSFYGNYSTMMQRVLRLLKKYKVDVYFSGHEHTFQLLKYDGIYFCVNGAGAYKSQLSQYNTMIDVYTVYSSINNGFVIHKISDSFLNLQFVNVSNIVEFDYHIPHKETE